MIGHVGTKVSALIDGQLPDAEAERLWDHVHACPLCRDRVEHEGWIKTRLAGLGMPSEQPAAPNYLRSVLCATTDLPTLPGANRWLRRTVVAPLRWRCSVPGPWAPRWSVSWHWPCPPRPHRPTAVPRRPP